MAARSIEMTADGKEAFPTGPHQAFVMDYCSFLGIVLSAMLDQTCQLLAQMKLHAVCIIFLQNLSTESNVC